MISKNMFLLFDIYRYFRKVNYSINDIQSKQDNLYMSLNLDRNDGLTRLNQHLENLLTIDMTNIMVCFLNT